MKMLEKFSCFILPGTVFTLARSSFGEDICDAKLFSACIQGSFSGSLENAFEVTRLDNGLFALGLLLLLDVIARCHSWTLVCLWSIRDNHICLLNSFKPKCSRQRVKNPKNKHSSQHMSSNEMFSFKLQPADRPGWVGWWCLRWGFFIPYLEKINEILILKVFSP